MANVTTSSHTSSIDSSPSILTSVHILLIVFGDNGHQLVFDYCAASPTLTSTVSPSQPQTQSVVSNTSSSSSSSSVFMNAPSSNYDGKNSSNGSAAPTGSDRLKKVRAVESRPLGLSAHTLARICCPKAQLCCKLLELDIDGVKFISWPMKLPAIPVSDITIFNVVLVDTSGRAHRSHLQHIPQHEACQQRRHNLAVRMRKLVQTLAVALAYEQRRCGFVSSQVGLCTKIREQGGGLTMLIQKSSLALALARLCDALASQSTAHVLINDWIDVYIAKPVKRDIDKAIRPYMTLVLLDDALTLLADLPKDASPQLRKLIRAANPMNSLRDLSTELGISLPQIFRLVAHLVFWGKARVLNALTKHTIFAVDSKTVVDEQICDDFRHRFSSHLLPEVMSRFNLLKQFEEHLRVLNLNAQHQFVSMVLWMLQRHLLIQLSTFVFLVPNFSHESKTNVEKNSRSFPTMNTTQSTTSSSGSESTFATKHSSSFDSADLVYTTHSTTSNMAQRTSKFKRLFRRLSRYFDGRHNFEEIMWRENVSRNDLARVLSDYDNFVCATVHE